MGDEVLVATKDGELVWDTIAVDASHVGADVIEYLEISSSDGRNLSVTANHYLHATSDGESASCCSESTLVAAEDVQIGNWLWTVPAGAESTAAGLHPARVMSVRKVRKAGAHNFWLAELGDASFRSLIANGVVASSFSSDMRLVHTLGFDVANRMIDPLRQTATELRGSEHSEGRAYKNPLMDHLEPLADVIADCVEQHLHACDLESRVAAVWQKALDETPEAAMAAISAALATWVYQQSGARLPHGARRLAAAVASRTGLLVRTITQSVREQSTKLCSMNDECRADMPADTVVLPLWAFILLVVVGATAMVLTFVLTCVLLVARRFRLKSVGDEKAKASTLAVASTDAGSKGRALCARRRVRACACALVHHDHLRLTFSMRCPR